MLKSLVTLLHSIQTMEQNKKILRSLLMLTTQQLSRKQVPVVGSFCERQEEADLSPVWDVEIPLLIFYHVPSLLLGVANPVPRKLRLAPVAGPAPKLPAEVEPVAESTASPEEAARFREELRRSLGGSGRRRADLPSANGQK